MNVTVENLGPCKKLLRFEVEVAQVNTAFEKAFKEVQRHARLPGFRPGKAPKDMLLRKFDKEIKEEAKKTIIGEAYRQGIKDHNINPVGYPDVEEIQFEKEQPAQFAATVETAPEFELPPYRGLVAKREMTTVTEEDMNKALDALRTQQAKFQTVDRPAAEGDIAVVNYKGTCEGKPITELAPVAKGLTEKTNFWVELKPESFIPGFAPQLYGAKAGEKRTVTVDFPADFVTKEVAGKQGVYEVELVEVKERVLPPVDQEFAKVYGAESVEALREGIRRDLQNELNLKQRRNIRMQVIDALLGGVNFEMPESVVNSETRNVVYQIVSENQRRGVSSEVLEQQKDSIYSAAVNSAKDRVKADFVFQKIAEKEGIRVTPEELSAHISSLAHAYKMTPQAFFKELQKRNGILEVESQLLHEKVINLLVENAKLEDVEKSA